MEKIVKSIISKFLIIFLTIILTIGCITKIDTGNLNQNDNQDENVQTGVNISIACWNLQIFGPSKSSNETLLDYYVEKLDDYDIFIVQEIRDVSGDAIKTLAEGFPEYQYIISNRAGQSTSKEQYAVFYNDQVTLIESYDYQAEYQQMMQRPPLKVTFTSNKWTFTIYTAHTQPNNVPVELTVLETIIDHPIGDAIIMGDLNADGSYYDEDNFAHFKDWQWIVTNDVDTTVASSNNTYDRIIINDASENNFIRFGVMDDVMKDQSDHYLLYAIFNNSSP